MANFLITGNPEGMMKQANFIPVAEKEKIILVYPAGVERNWNDCRPTTPNQLGINDVSFINQVIDDMISKYPVDGTSQDMNGCEVIWSFFKNFKS